MQALPPPPPAVAAPPLDRSEATTGDLRVAAALTDVVAAGLAAITLVVMRRAEDRTTRGDRRVPTRWVLATGDAERTEKAEAVR